MIHARSRRRRNGFTLLEMILAAAIAVLLLSGLYVAMDLQLRHAQAARDIVEQSTLARALIQRMSGDIAPSLGQPDPLRFRSSSGGSAAAGATSGTTTTGSGQTSSTTSTTGTGGTGSSAGTGTDSAAAPAATTSGTSSSPGLAPALFSLRGDSTTLSIMVSRVPRNPVNPDDPEVPAGVSDLRRISYYLAGSGDSALGLVRHEVLAVTSEEATAEPPEVSDPTAKSLIAPEVRELSFSYWDGTAWQESWDSEEVGSDGMTPVGPPLGIAVRITIIVPGAGPDSEVKPKTYRHVISIPTANGAAQQSTTDSGSTTP